MATLNGVKKIRYCFNDSEENNTNYLESLKDEIISLFDEVEINTASMYTISISPVEHTLDGKNTIEATIEKAS